MVHKNMRLSLIAASILLMFGCAKNVQVSYSFGAGGLYTVQKGDTVHTIAAKKKISAFDLMEVNGIVNSDALKVGQKIYIPEPDIGLAQVRSLSKVAAKPATKPAPVYDGKKVDLAWPVKNSVLFKGFDLNPNRLHEGIALGAPKGTPVMAAQDGEVIYVGDDGTRYGRIVIIKHEDPFVTIYAHLDQVDVSKGKMVKRQESIGTVGTSGGVDSPRVYFQVRKNRTPVDPETYLKH